MTQVGDTVIYIQPNSEVSRNGTYEHPATITRVWSTGCVNLVVFFDDGIVEHVTSVVDDNVGSGNWRHK